MQIKMTGNEVLSSGSVSAGAAITITASNADELFALALMQRGILVDDMAVASAPGDVGPAYASFVARRVESGISLSDAAPVVGAAAGSFLARVRTPGSAATLSLLDDGGGRVALSGRTLVAGSAPFVAGVPVKIAIAVGGEQRTFTLYPAVKKAALNPLPTPSSAITFSDGTPLQFSDGSYLELAA